MSHADTILELPDGFDVLATTETIPYAAFKKSGYALPLYCLQFHPEVYHSIEGKKILRNFLVNICHCCARLDSRAFHQRHGGKIKKTNWQTQSDYGFERRRRFNGCSNINS